MLNSSSSGLSGTQQQLILSLLHNPTIPLGEVSSTLLLPISVLPLNAKTVLLPRSEGLQWDGEGGSPPGKHNAPITIYWNSSGCWYLQGNHQQQSLFISCRDTGSHCKLHCILSFPSAPFGWNNTALLYIQGSFSPLPLSSSPPAAGVNSSRAALIVSTETIPMFFPLHPTCSHCYRHTLTLRSFHWPNSGF